MPTRTLLRRSLLRRSPLVRSLFLGALALPGALTLPLALWARPAAAQTAPTPLATIKPERGFIDDAFTLSADGTLLYYANTDGATYTTLRAVGLPGAAAGSAQAAATAAPPGPGTSVEILGNLPLGVTKVLLLPEARVLIVSRDEGTGVLSGAVYSLATRAAVPVPGPVKAALSAATDIVLAQTADGPTLVAVTRPTDTKNDYKIAAVHAGSLKLLGQRAYRVRESDGRIQTAQGSATPLYFVDDYLTLVAKHDGTYDKKRDVRQPDFLAFVDALTGKVKQSRAIGNPTALLEAAQKHTTGESTFVLASAETQRVELLTPPDPSKTDGPADIHTPLQMPRPVATYEPLTLRYQLVRPRTLLVSLTVDPVNEQAVAAHHTDPDWVDLCVVDLTRPSEPPRRVLTLPGQKRPTAWTVSPSGRLALLRKHKGFSRGGTEIEIYDVDLGAGAEAAAPTGPKTAAR